MPQIPPTPEPRSARRRAGSPHGLLLGATLALLALLAAPLPLGAQEAEPPPPLFVDRVDVNVVNVEVFVTDEEGRRVVGLEKDDFEIYEDGEPREITNFFAFARQDRLLQPLAEGETGVAAVPPARPSLPEDQRLHLVVYVDHFNSTPVNRNRVLDDLEPWLEDRMRSGDRVMLVAYEASGDLRVVEPFTDDYVAVVDGFERMRRAATHRQIDDAERLRTVRLMNQRPQAVGEPDSAYQFLRSHVQNERQELRNSLEALERTLRSLAGVPGRKALIHVSDGLPQRPGEDLYEHLREIAGGGLSDFDDGSGFFVDPTLETLREDETILYTEITRQANAHEVTLYPIDARGPTAGSTVTAAEADIYAGPGARVTQQAMRQLNLQEPLVELAEATGGRSVLNTFAIEDAVTRVSEDFDVFYSLGYAAPEPGDGGYHRIEVRVKRPGLRVRHRAGYVDKPEEELVADRTLSALLFDLGSNPLGIEIELGKAQRQKKGRYHLPVMVRIPIDRVTLLPDSGLHRGRLQIVIGVRDETGISALHTIPYPVDVPPDALAEARERDIGYVATLRVRPGRPTIAVGVWDEISGDEAYVQQEVRVGPRPGRGRG